MNSNQALNPSMKVLENSPQTLVILDGAKVYSYGVVPSAKSLIIQPLLAFTVTSVLTFIASSSFQHALGVGTAIAAFPFIGLLLVRIYGGGRQATYTFDKRSGILECSTPAVFPFRPSKISRYTLNDVLAVEAVTQKNDDPPPVWWRSIELRMPTQLITLYPGHDATTQEIMTHLIKDFLFFGK